MIRELRQSTAVTQKSGPFVDASDGSTEEIALTITQSNVLISKNGAALAQKNDSSNSAHDDKGYYNVKLNAIDTNTLGSLIVVIHMPGALPVWEYFMVVTQNYFDAKYGSTLMNVTTAGTGTVEFIYTMYEDEDAETGPISNCYVWVSTDIAGTNIVASGYTDDFGKVTFWLNAGTYYFWRSRGGYNFTNPDTEVVS
jgi:hypothetical protein